ncbi:hypothetical protein BH11PSE6_BH11PSE6_12460 [soil metagenome]
MTGADLPVVVNRAGGTAAAAGADLGERLTAAFAAADTGIALQLLDGPELADAVRGASGARVIVGGGDGTAAAAAAVLADGAVELGLLPLGTLNHLARDLGIPRDLDEAALLAAHGDARAIDLGEVNGHVFVNNASIGLYPAMVRRRDAYRESRGLPKWVASFPAAWQAWTHFRRRRLTLDTGGGPRPLATSLLFVGNNRYSLERGEIGCRDVLDGGRLSIFALAAPGRFALLWFALRAVTGRADRNADFLAFGDGETLTVESPGTADVEVALDGEVMTLAFPLRFRIRPGALRIVAPPSAKGPAERPGDAESAGAHQRASQAGAGQAVHAARPAR